MRIIPASSDTPVNHTELRKFIQTTYQVAKLSVEKAALHHVDPQRYPLDRQAQCYENIVLPYFQQLPPDKQQNVRNRAAALVNTPPDQRARSYGLLAGVNLQSPLPVSEQVYGSPRVPALLTDMSRIADDGGDVPRRGPGGIDEWPPRINPGDKDQGQLPLKRYVLNLHNVSCVKETGEWGKDEIDLGATAVVTTTQGGVPVTSTEINLDPFRVGSFHSGDVAHLGSKILYAFSAPNDNQYPIGFLVTLLLIEKDFGKVQKIRDLLHKLQGELEKQIINLRKHNLDTGTIVKLVLLNAAVILTGIVSIIAGWLGDDVFDPVTVSLSVDSPNARLSAAGDSTEPATVTATRRGGDDGIYTLAYSWHVFA